jgi:hypothetical protein
MGHQRVQKHQADQKGTNIFHRDRRPKPDSGIPSAPRYCGAPKSREPGSWSLAIAPPTGTRRK